MTLYTRNPPSWPFPSGISSPPSRLQLILGVGFPAAAHLRVTLLPSLTTMSALVGLSKISGGTVHADKSTLQMLDLIYVCARRENLIIGCNNNNNNKSFTHLRGNFFSDKIIRTNDLQVSSLIHHGISVDLTHVFALVRLSDVPYVQVPCLVLGVSDGDAVILGDYVISYCQDGLSVDLQPRYLYKYMNNFFVLL